MPYIDFSWSDCYGLILKENNNTPHCDTVDRIGFCPSFAGIFYCLSRVRRDSQRRNKRKIRENKKIIEE